MYQFPPPLKTGDTIAVTAPSSGVPAPLHARLNLVLSHLRDKGFHVIEGQCLREDKGFVSAPAEQRAAELMAFLTDDNIAAIIPPYGGELATELLPLLDFNALCKAKAKWLIGYSDTSTLLTSICSRAKWATVHSSCLMEWVPEQSEPLTNSVLQHLATENGGTFHQQSSKRYELHSADWKALPEATFQLTQKTQWKSLGKIQSPKIRQSMSGRLFGGCLDILMLQLDGPFIDFEGIKKFHGADGTILYLENAELSPTALKRALLSMRHKSLFENLHGLLFGRHAGVDNDTHEVTYEQVIRDVFDDAEYPVFYDVDIGHVPPNLTLINGAFTKVELQDKHARIQQRLS